MSEQKALWGWYPAGNTWVKLQVAATGKLVIDPTALFENPPTEDEAEKGPSSEWAFDHDADPDAHHIAFTPADHLAIGDAAPHHPQAHTLASHTTRAHAELTGVGASDHHVKYTDAEAIAAAKTDPTLLNYTQGARVYNDANQAIANITLTTIVFPHETYDTDVIHDLVTNNSRLTCKTAGYYVISISVQFAIGSTGRRAVWILYNNTTRLAQTESQNTASSICITVTTIYYMAVNDYVEAQVYQNNGTSLDVLASAEFSPEFMMQRIG